MLIQLSELSEFTSQNVITPLLQPLSDAALPCYTNDQQIPSSSTLQALQQSPTHVTLASDTQPRASCSTISHIRLKAPNSAVNTAVSFPHCQDFCKDGLCRNGLQGSLQHKHLSSL